MRQVFFRTRRRIIARSLGKTFFTFVNARIREGRFPCTQHRHSRSGMCVTLYANLYHTPFIIIHNLSNVTMLLEMVKILSASTKKSDRLFVHLLLYSLLPLISPSTGTIVFNFIRRVLFARLLSRPGTIWFPRNSQSTSWSGQLRVPARYYFHSGGIRSARTCLANEWCRSIDSRDRISRAERFSLGNHATV